MAQSAKRMRTDVDNLLAGQQASEAAAGRRQQEVVDLFNALVVALSEFRALVTKGTAESRRQQIECEVRLGLFVQQHRRWHGQEPNGQPYPLQPTQQELRFVSGVDVSTFHRAQRILDAQRMGFRKHASNTRTLIDTSNNRQAEDMDTGVRTADNKQQMPGVRYELGLTACPFDARFSASYETAPQPLGTPVTERIKRRVTYESSLLVWKVEFTEVTTKSLVDLNAVPETAYEVEFELTPAGSAEWMSSRRDNDREYIIYTVASHLYHVFKLINPELTHSGVQGLQTCSDVRVKGEVQNLFRNLAASVGQNLSRHNTFIGAMPISMSRQHLPVIRAERYYATEKTDGVRYLLCVVADKAYLVDRSCVVYEMVGGAKIGAALGTGTVLDGELVPNVTHHLQEVFLVFDVLSNRGNSVMPQPFSNRLRLIEEQIMPRVTGVMEAESYNPATITFMTRKIFFDKLEVGLLFQRIQLVDGERRYDDGSGKRHHKTDGIIFQPDTPYKPSTDEKLLKWKFLDTVTVDLQVTESEGTGMRLVCSAQDGLQIDCTARYPLDKMDMFRIRADCATLATPIIEVLFDVSTGSWSYKGVRHDKNVPNFITTVMGALIELAENVTEEELIETFSHSGHK